MGCSRGNLASRRTMIVTRDNFDERLTDDERQRFWALVRNALGKIFDADPQLADEYRNELENASVGERIAAYHDSPLSVAADLAGWSKPIPNEMVRIFLDLQRIYAKEISASRDQTLNLPKINKLMVGESLVGDGSEVAHIDLIIGPRGSAAETAFATALTNNKEGFTSLLAVVAPNLPVKPSTVMFNKVTIKGAKQAVQMFGPAQHAVATAVADSVADGTIPAEEADDVFICVGVFIHWEASDDRKIHDFNYRAVKESIERAVSGRPTPTEVVTRRDTVKLGILEGPRL
jgi:5,6,7,8-tetrahydromethanopterin hydro-lyase